MIGAVLLVLAYSIWVLGRWADPVVEPYAASLVLTLLDVLVGIFGLQIAFQKGFDQRLRRGWLFLGLASLFSAFGEVVWLVYNTILGVDPFPSWADLFFLIYYPLTLIGILIFPFTPVTRRERNILWLDLTIVMVSSITIFWYFLLAPIRYTNEQGLAGAIAVAYPIGDLLIFAGVTALIQRDVEKLARWTLIFLACGMVFMTFADVLFAYFEVNHTPYNIAYLNILWLSATLCQIAAAAWQIFSEPITAPVVSVRFSGAKRLLRTVLPYAAASIGPILLVIVVNSQFVPGPELRGLLFGTLGMIGLVLLRQYIVLMENVRLYHETQRLANTDSLTGLYNRHYFNESLQREVERTRRYGQSLSVLLMDVDDFKKFNDTFGHLQGDVVLKVVARELSGQLRTTDILARFGGDEFAIILPETDLAGAQVVAAKMERCVASSKLTDYPLGISIGAAAFQPDLTPEHLLDEADRALYRHKNSKYMSAPEAAA